MAWLQRKAWFQAVWLLVFIDACLRGVGQILFMNNPVTGIFTVAGYFYSDVYLGMALCVGTVASTGLAFAMGLVR